MAEQTATIALTAPADVLLDEHRGARGDGKSTKFNEPIELARGLWLGRLDDAWAKRIGRAVTYRGLNHTALPPIVRYALVRFKASSGEGWDPDCLLEHALALSRLVHPTAWGLRYSAEVFPAPNDDGHRIQAVEHRQGRFVFLPEPMSNEQLCPDDGLALRQLLASFQTPGRVLPQRVGTAMWRNEYYRWDYYLDAQWPHLATAIDALIHTRRGKTGAEYRQRLPRLAADVGAALSAVQAEQIWDEVRSPLVHGEYVRGLISGPKLDLFIAASEAVRLAVRRCIEDPTFAAAFQDESSIESQWPVR